MRVDDNITQYSYIRDHIDNTEMRKLIWIGGTYSYCFINNKS